jgi:hypothetical protein
LAKSIETRARIHLYEHDQRAVIDGGGISVIKIKRIRANQGHEAYALAGNAEPVDARTALHTVGFEMVVIRHRERLELYEHHEPRGSVAIDRLGKKNICEWIEKSILLGGQCLENYGRDRREILLQPLKLVVPDTLAPDRPEFPVRRRDCGLKRRGKRQPRHRILGRNDKVCIRCARVAQEGSKLRICQCMIAVANTRAADFDVALGCISKAV